MPNSVNARVLIVEDELIVALNLSKELEQLGYSVVGLASSEKEAIALAHTNTPDVILMDINLQAGGSGINAAADIAKTSAVPIIYVTAYSSDKIIELAGHTNPYGYILKPYNVKEVKAAINIAMIRRKYEDKITQSEKRLTAAMRAAEMDILEFDFDKKVVSLSQLTEKFHQLGFRHEMSSQQFYDLFAAQDAKELKQLTSLQKPFTHRAQMRHPISDRYQYFDVFLTDIHFNTGRIQIGAVQDVTSNQSNIDNLIISDSILMQMQEGVVILDKNENIQQSNSAFSELTGFTQSELTGRCIHTFLLHDRKDDVSPFARLDNTKHIKNVREITIRCKDQVLVHAMMTVSDLISIGQDDKLILTFTDVSRLVEAERNLNKIAFTDTLTGFGNRAYLNRLLKSFAESTSSNTIALFFIDIDCFKRINDTLGHDFGDKVLIEFSLRLASILRENDHLVRIGGDEFVAIVIGSYTDTDLDKIGKKLLKQLELHFDIDNHHIDVSCSMGIAFSSCQNFKPGMLMKQADSAMYHAKKAGKNAYRFFDKALADKIEYRIFIEQGLASAIRDKKISIYLQQIVDKDGQAQSVEALCRWYDDDVGFIPPNVFVPVAEETGLIHTLGFYVINESMIAKKQLIEAGFPHIIVNINFSEKQLQNKDTFTAVCELLDHYELSASGFVIEITESILHRSSSDITIRQLKERGFKFALDDFGTGYSSLSRLHDYSVDIIKIDKSFVDLLCHNTKQNLITQAILEMGQLLGFKVVAEGVETEEQRQLLEEMGCGAMQGFLFAKPVPMHELLKALK